MNRTKIAKELRRKAEEQVASQPVVTGEPDVKRLLHELQVHKVELEMLVEELRQANAEISDHKEHLINIIKMTPAGYFHIDLAGRFLDVNDAFLHMHGYDSVDEIVGKHFSMMQVDGTSDSAIAHLVELKKGVSIPYGEFRSRCKDGSVGYHIFSAHPVEKMGNIFGFEWFIIDITEQKKVTREREELVSQLLEKTAEQERFIYTVSHDLKSPLVSISCFTDLAEQGLNSGNQVSAKNDLATIKQSALRMRRLLDELLEISRIGIKKNPEEVVNLSTLIDEGVFNISGLIKEFHTTIEVESDLPDVMLDKQRFLQVIENLIANASRYSKSENDGSHVKIGVTRNAEELICYVKDNGIGIEAQYLEKVFGLFEKLDSNSDSTGVGLAIVKRIIENHGGRIWAESEGLGHGTTFSFTLPEAA